MLGAYVRVYLLILEYVLEGQDSLGDFSENKKAGSHHFSLLLPNLDSSIMLATQLGKTTRPTCMSFCRSALSNPLQSGGVPPKQILQCYILQAAPAGTSASPKWLLTWGEGKITTHTSTLAAPAAKPYNWQCTECPVNQYIWSPQQASALTAGPFHQQKPLRGQGRESICRLVLLQPQWTKWGQMSGLSVGSTHQLNPLKETR